MNLVFKAEETSSFVCNRGHSGLQGRFLRFMGRTRRPSKILEFFARPEQEHPPGQS